MINYTEEIKKLKEEKNAIILGHYYQNSDIQDVVDFVGDSLDLSKKSNDANADIILFCGVHFMAETAKILSPKAKVLLPDLNAGCSLADSCLPNDFKKFIEKHPNHKVISYINCSAEIKALSDVICTSSNAVNVVNSFAKDQKIIFAPDKNLGKYVMKQTGRSLVLWDGSCEVHEVFSLSKLLSIKALNSDAKTIAHPECEEDILEHADFIGSTKALLNYVVNNKSEKFIVVTESGIIHQMEKKCPNKIFIPAPPNANCACNECPHMKINTIEKVYYALKNEKPEILLDENIRKKAENSLNKMLEIV